MVGFGGKRYLVLMFRVFLFVVVMVSILLIVGVFFCYGNVDE